MKKVLGYLYLVVFMSLITVFVLTSKTEDAAPEAEPQKAPHVHWTYGVDYDSLVPIQSLTRSDPELQSFLTQLAIIVGKNDWQELVNMANADHYANQGSFLGNDTVYVHDVLSIQSYWTGHIWIKNSLGYDEASGLGRLDRIKALRLIGRSQEPAWAHTYAYYGYVEKKNGVMLACCIHITKRTGKYELTGEVG